jgi:hypothetical protein
LNHIPKTAISSSIPIGPNAKNLDAYQIVDESLFSFYGPLSTDKRENIPLGNKNKLEPNHN